MVLRPWFWALLAVCQAHNYTQTYSSNLQCRVNDPLSCDQQKHEVCVFTNGRYRCECPNGITRLSDGRCLMVNECARPSLNTCHKNARCIDWPDGYTCQCNAGYADVSSDRVNKPGRICQRTQNECSAKETYGVDCDPQSACVDTPEGFKCVCQPGYADISATLSQLPGRKCVEHVNECQSGKCECSTNADCFDRPDGYECKCRPGFVDASPDAGKYPGRVCNRPKSPEYYGQQSRQPQCSSKTPCGENEECRFNTKGEMVCQCRRGSVQQSDGRCKEFSHCEKANECDRNAFCSNTFDGYKCQCKSGYKDISPEPLRLPGRKCQQLVNECADGTSDCSPYAVCEDTPESYICKCKPGFTDVSSRYGLQPGRKCAEGASQCKDSSLNSCDKNADCVQLPDGYTCKCFMGYVDVSSNANLPPGRVCTLSTACPAQATDLVFLIDGSGSIGSYIFQNEVLRFLSEFSELFDIAPEKTQVSVVQYSDQIRHEFGLNEYKDSKSLNAGIKSIDYLTGLTRTGAAIEHVANEAFSDRRGARPRDQVSRVGIVITDGRSQDNVTVPANNARRLDIQLFAVGVTNHVLDSELEEIAGSKERTFHVNGFEDLNTRLRSAIQRVACPQQENDRAPTEVIPTYPIQVEPTTHTNPPEPGPCNPADHEGCDRAKNQICVMRNGKPVCECPPGFDLHPVSKKCGGDVCNPEISSSCPDPEICEKTPFGNWRCTCPADLGWRDPHTGACKIGTRPPAISENNDQCKPGSNDCGPNAKCVKGPGGELVCQCREGLVRNLKSDKCQEPGTCDPSLPDACDARKREKCLPDTRGLFSCQCPRHYKRHQVTEICLIDECASGQHDCDPKATCTDTDESYICSCNAGYLDKSPDAKRKPGRFCVQQENECETGRHNCSANAECVDLPEGFLCRCKSDFVDLSPNPHAFGGLDCRPLVDECLGNNTCHANAICIDTRDSYKCKCKDGFVDHDELRNPGRDCRKQNQNCEGNKHDCDANARCIEKGTNDYECVCNPGFLDKSPLPNKLGRNCLERVCLNESLHDCHIAAICEEVVGPEKYTCKCRDGYVDKSPSTNKPGRICRELVNECLSPSLNDCDPAATCHDQDDGYTCQCPIGSKDQSPDPKRPGRNCHALMNECTIPALNNCSRFADCIDKEEGYACKCKEEYFDLDPAHPGLNCKFIIDECKAENLNDCDLNAVCKDTIDGYTCECKKPFEDLLPDTPGRKCRYNECLKKEDNDCHEHADCVDTDDSYLCQCKTGFFDESTNPADAGRICIGLAITGPSLTATKPPVDPNAFPCGNGRCDKRKHEVCIGGSKCGCRPGEARATIHDECVAVREIDVPLFVEDFDDTPLHYSTDYSRPQSPAHVEVAEAIKKGLDKVFKKTFIGPRYVSTDVNYITSPKTENSTWDQGLLVNSKVQVSGQEDVDKCKLFREFANEVVARGGRVDRIKLNDNFQLLDPCRVEDQKIKGIPCGNFYCNEDLGEICIAGKICGCPKGQKRRDSNSPCRVVESWNLPLYVIRDGDKKIEYSHQLANPQNSHYKTLVNRFESGVAESYDKTPLKSGFITAEVNDIEKPNVRNASWVDGVLYNFTSYFVKGAVAKPSTVYTELLEYVAKKNNHEVGTSKLFISSDQMNPFSACYKSDCHPTAICKEVGNSFTCACADGYRDLNPVHPGRQCLAFRGVNECEDPKLNECSPDARCIDMDYLYKCQCMPPYVNSAPEGSVPGSICSIDYCSDVNFCPLNSTCKNVDEQAKCDCKPGFIDLRKSERLSTAGLGDTICLRTWDVDECALGLHNCSAAATCTDKKSGYDCKCNDGYTDGNPAEPGRVCAALLCGLCNGHGDCIHDALTNNVTCACVDGYTGEFCQVAPSKAGLILMLLLALLFLLLTLLCCLWMCLRTRCFGARGGHSEGSASGQEILGSDYYTIPRAKLAKAGGYGDEAGGYGGGHENAGALAAYLDDGASISSGGSLEEVERRVTTDVTTREVRTTVVRDEHGNVISQSQMVSHGPLEAEREQYGVTSSDHFRSAESSGGRFASSAYNSDSEGETEVYDKVTRVNESHDFQPGGDPRTGIERRRNEVVTTTTSNDVNYF